MKLDLPPRIRIEPHRPDARRSQRMLAEGEIDALYTARACRRTFYRRPRDVRRLFPDLHAVEKAYYREDPDLSDHAHGGDPAEVYEANRWIAQSLYKAFKARSATRTTTCASPRH